MVKDFDLTGFVNFPNVARRDIKMVDSGKTYVYIVSFDLNEKAHKYSNIRLKLSGNFCGDDISPRDINETNQLSIDSIIENMREQDNYDNFYFPNQSKESIPLISCTIIGWSKYSFEYKDRLSPWCCNFRDLTNEGRRLFYAIKKLHNEKEIRILTFNNIILK